MPVVRVESFTGVIPKTDPLLLPGNAAQVAKNVRLETGALRPWCGEQLAYKPDPIDSELKTIYRLQGSEGREAVWLTFDQDVDIVPGPVADIREHRIYYTGEFFSPRKTNSELASQDRSPPYPNRYYEMGVPGPKLSPTLVAQGSGDTPEETRAYVYTWVTLFGTVEEESAPSPATLVQCFSADDLVTVSGFDTHPEGNYNYQKLRIYRSVTGTSSANYQLVEELPINTTVYDDDKTVAELGITLESTYYTPPPSGLHGLVSMAGGFLAGFVGNQIWFSEVYVPHAWPSLYMQTVDYPIVGIAAIDNSLLVFTEKYPYILVGSSPNGISATKLGMLEPCVSKRSIAQDQYGVFYASPNGLVTANLGDAKVMTQSLLLRRQWEEYNPTTMCGVLYNNMYLGYYRGKDDEYKTVVFHRSDNPPMSDYEYPAVAAYVEPTTGDLFVVNSNDHCIYRLDNPAVTPDQIYNWRSKPLVMTHAVSFAWLQVFAHYDEAVMGSDIEVRIYADGEFYYSVSPTNDQPIRMPGATRALTWEIEVLGTTPVTRILMANTTSELRGVS